MVELDSVRVFFRLQSEKILVFPKKLAHAPNGARADFDLNTLFKHERRIIGSYSGSLTEQKEIFELICAGCLDPSPLVTHTIPLDEFTRGVELVVTQKALKVLFTPSRAVEG